MSDLDTYPKLLPKPISWLDEKQPWDDQAEEQVPTILEYIDKVPKEKLIEVVKRMFEHRDISYLGIDINEPIHPRRLP